MKKRFIGFYDYTVLLTYLSLISSVFGITQAIHGHYKTAILCLAFSGICDSFDGLVARSKKNRTEDEKNFGIQLDSLVDVICFGVFPALICYLLGMRGVLGLTICFLYCLCAVIRLAFFNVLEAKRQRGETGGNKIYHGLPVTSMGFILPLAFWLQFIMPDVVFLALLHVLMVLVSFLFILDFPLRKPSLKMNIVLITLVVITMGAIVAYTQFVLPPQNDTDNAVISGIEDAIDEEAIPGDGAEQDGSEQTDGEPTPVPTETTLPDATDAPDEVNSDESAAP